VRCNVKISVVNEFGLSPIGDLEDIEVSDIEEAKSKAYDEFWDDRLDITDSSPDYEVEVLEDEDDTPDDFDY